MHQISMPSGISLPAVSPSVVLGGVVQTTLVYSDGVYNETTTNEDQVHPSDNQFARYPLPSFEDKRRKPYRPQRRKHMPSFNYNKDFLYVVLVLTVVEPYEERLEYYESICTGVFIGPNVVLTLRQCVFAAYYDYLVEPHPSFTTVYMKDGVILRTMKIHMYMQTSEIDYAVVIVESSGLTEFPKLPTGNLNFAQMKNSCLMAGFGNQNRLMISNFRVRSLQDREVTEVKCWTENHVCLHFKNLKPCRGDQGSPLICDGVIYALYTPAKFSPPHRCVDRYSTEFTLLFPTRQWIDQITSAPSLEWVSSPWYPLALCGSVMLVMVLIYYLLAEFVIKPVARKFDRHLSEVSQSLDSQEAQERRLASVVTTASADADAEANNQKYIDMMYWYR